MRASCSIPFFFQPVDSDASFLVDGGLLANLPIFLVPALELSPGTPVLAFRLVQERSSPPEQPSSAFQLLRAVIDSTLNGVTEVQLSLEASRQVIDIQTGTIGTTDFNISSDQIDELVTAGEK